MPILLTNNDRHDPEYKRPQMRPNIGDTICLPIKKSKIVVIIPDKAETKRAANSVFSNSLKETVWSQKNNGGFSQKGSLFTVTCI